MTKDLLATFAAGGFLIVTDDASRENEGDLILLAQSAQPESIAFMVRHTSGVLCAALTREIAHRLKLPMMVAKNQDPKGTAYTVSVDAKAGITTGISASERALTLRLLANKEAVADDLTRPGHIFPLVEVEGGLTQRRGHTEAGVALARAVGAQEVAVIAELVNDDGSMMRGQALRDFANTHQIPMLTIDDVIALTPQAPTTQPFTFEWAQLPREGAQWQIATYPSREHLDHVVLKYGAGGPTIRMHSECLTGDALGSLRCDCGEQLAKAFAEIEKRGGGYIIYLRNHEGRGIGLTQKIAAYRLQDQGRDTVDANLALGHGVDERQWDEAVEILTALALPEVELLTNNPSKVSVLEKAGIKVTQRPHRTDVLPENQSYLETKQSRMGHELGI